MPTWTGFALGNPGGTTRSYGITPEDLLTIEAALLPFGRSKSGYGEDVWMFGGAPVKGALGAYPSPMEDQQSRWLWSGDVLNYQPQGVPVGLGRMADSVPGANAPQGMQNSMSNQMSTSVSQNQSVTANPVTNLNLNTSGLSSAQAAPNLATIGLFALAALMGWKILS